MIPVSSFPAGSFNYRPCSESPSSIGGKGDVENYYFLPVCAKNCSDLSTVQ